VNTATSDIAPAPRHIRVTEETIEGVGAIRRATGQALNWNCLFTLPVWLEAWSTCCGGGFETRIYAARHKDRLLGLAPLRINGARAGFIGSADLCDYLDFIVAEGRENEFFAALLDYLCGRGITQVDLGPLRPDSAAWRHLRAIAPRLGWRPASEADEICFEMELPPSWEDYLAGLTGKQRHEVRRKLRRLDERADYALRIVRSPEAAEEGFDTFMKLFRQSRADKNEFLTEARQAFFRLLTEQTAAAAMLRLYILDIDGAPAAAALCFDHAGTLYLYNSGYDQRFADLSAGQMCVLMTIRDSIAMGRKWYNFLKGEEVYKKRMGGRPVQLMRLRLDRDTTLERERPPR